MKLLCTARTQRTYDADTRGFTLIELLVAIVIIGILATLAILQYNDYRARSFDARALSDLRNIMSAQEAYFSDNESYVATIETLTGFETESPSVTAILTATADTWTGSSYHPLGTKTFCYDTDGNTGIVEVDGAAGACP